MKTPESTSNNPIQESAPRRLFSGLSPIMDQVLLSDESRNSLRVCKILSTVNGVLIVNEASAESSAKRLENGSSDISWSCAIS